MFLAIGDRLPSSDHLGAFLAVWIVGIAGLVGAVWVANRLGGPAAAVAAAILLVSTPAIWMSISSLRVDTVLSACVIATIAAILRPTLRRWVLAGFLLGVTILVKETSGLLVFLPLAWIGTMSVRRWIQLSTAYLVTAAVTAAWWWVMVWVKLHEIFPKPGVSIAASRTFPRAFEFNGFAWLLIGLLALGCVGFAYVARAEPRARTVVIGLLALLAPALYAWKHELALRQFIPLAVLACVAAGAFVGPRAFALFERGGGARLAGVGLCCLGVGCAAAAQARVSVTHRDGRPVGPVAEWIEPRLDGDATIVASKGAQSFLALELFGDADVARLTWADQIVAPELDEFVWLGTFRATLGGLRRSTAEALLADESTAYLVLFTPHRTAPPELITALSTPPGLPGVRFVHESIVDGQHASIFSVDPTVAGPAVARFRVRMTTAAAMLWLDQTAADTSEAASVARFIAAEPVVYGSPADLTDLTERIGTTDAVDLVPVG